jgi:UPF0042 nucleotide-binding protein
MPTPRKTVARKSAAKPLKDDNDQQGSGRAMRPELFVITGLSGSGMGTVLKELEDLGYYAVDNLPLALLETFAALVKESPTIRRAALMVDIREGDLTLKFPEIYKRLKTRLRTGLLFLDADDETLLRRYSETRRPHPLGKESLAKSLKAERRLLEPIRDLADQVIVTSEMTPAQLRRLIGESFAARSDAALRVSVMSFGFRHGIPAESDLVFDVRFLPNPNYVPEFKPLSGKNARVARYVKSFAQTGEFLRKIGELLEFLMPHYIAEGKSYLTIAFGCTGGRHRSVMMAEEVGRVLQRLGYAARVTHRDVDLE